jgi:hypothetical protein
MEGERRIWGSSFLVAGVTAVMEALLAPQGECQGLVVQVGWREHRSFAAHTSLLLAAAEVRGAPAGMRVMWSRCRRGGGKESVSARVCTQHDHHRLQVIDLGI